MLGTANGWFLKIQSKVHIDQVIEAFGSNCPKLERLEIQWDPDTIRFSDKSNKFVDRLRYKNSDNVYCRCEIDDDRCM